MDRHQTVNGPTVPIWRILKVLAQAILFAAILMFVWICLAMLGW